MEKAIQFFKKALQIDIFCYEAYETLIESHMLTSKEGFHLRNSFILFFFFLILQFECSNVIQE